MKLSHLAFVLLIFLSGTFHAFAQGEGVVAWQVTRFDLTVNMPPAGERALSVHAILAARNVGNAAGRTFTVRLNAAAQVKSATVNEQTAQFTSRADTKLKIQQVVINLPGAVNGAPGGNVNVIVDYALPVNENTALLALTPEGAQGLPLGYWYPQPNTIFAPRGADYAPAKITINAPSGQAIISTGRQNGATFEQNLNVQPFFLTGKWDVIEGGAEARGASAYLPVGARADEKQRAIELVQLAAAARKFLTENLGDVPDIANSPVRLIAVSRGAGFSTGGAILLDQAAFRRSKTDAITALQIIEGVAQMWIGGAAAVHDAGADVVREGLTRFLATQFLERQFGRDAAEAELLRERIAYSAIARRDAPLALSTPVYDTHYTSVTNKGAMVWRLIERNLGGDANAQRAAFNQVVRGEIARGRENGTTLAALRAAFAERGGDGLRKLMDYEFDQPTDMDLLVGLPQQRGGEWVSALRNTGSIEVNVNVAAVTDAGERLVVNTTIAPRDFGEAHFRTNARIARTEIDAEKLYPQIDYANDVAPRAPALQESLASAAQLFAQNKYAEAETTARDILQRAPLYQEARIVLARSLLEEKKYDEAEREFKLALNNKLPLPTTLAWANVGLGEIARARGNNAEAAKRFDEAARVEGEYAATLYARNARIAAENAANNAPAIDAAVRDFIARLDAAIKAGRRAELEALLVPGELTAFAKGIVGSQPETWTTRVLRTEELDSNRIAADVSINARTLGKDQSGTALFILSRAGGSVRLEGIQLFEVR
jgi:tetratricopeptide (TPR) repeat protein